MSTSPSSAPPDEPLPEQPPVQPELHSSSAEPAIPVKSMDPVDPEAVAKVFEPPIASLRSADTMEQRLHDVIAFISEKLAERGSASEAEEHTAQLVTAELKAMGLAPQQQNFLGLASAYAPITLAAGLALLSLFLFWRMRDTHAMTLAALILLGVVIAALIYELSLRDNVLRWWLGGEYTQNVFVHFPAASPTTTTTTSQPTPSSPVLITTHLDTHRTPLLFSSPAWLQFSRQLIPLGLISLAALWVLYLIGFITSLDALRWIALVPGVIVLLIFGLLIQAGRSPFSPGANDNASGIAAGLELAAQLAQSPLQRHDVYLVFTGGGEAACTGADAFIREYLQKNSNRPIHFVINRIAGPGTQPTLVQSEQFLRPANSDAGLLQLAEQVQVAHPDLQAQVKGVTATYSELSVGARHGLRTLGFTALPANNAGGDAAVPHWHQAGDTVANCDIDVAARTITLIWEVLQAVNVAAAAGAGAAAAATPAAVPADVAVNPAPAASEAR